VAERNKRRIPNAQRSIDSLNHGFGFPSADTQWICQEAEGVINQRIEQYFAQMETLNRHARDMEYALIRDNNPKGKTGRGKKNSTRKRNPSDEIARKKRELAERLEREREISTGEFPAFIPSQPAPTAFSLKFPSNKKPNEAIQRQESLPTGKLIGLDALLESLKRFDPLYLYHQGNDRRFSTEPAHQFLDRRRDSAVYEMSVRPYGLKLDPDPDYANPSPIGTPASIALPNVAMTHQDFLNNIYLKNNVRMDRASRPTEEDVYRDVDFPRPMLQPRDIVHLVEMWKNPPGNAGHSADVNWFPSISSSNTNALSRWYSAAQLGRKLFDHAPGMPKELIRYHRRDFPEDKAPILAEYIQRFKEATGVDIPYPTPDFTLPIQATPSEASKNLWEQGIPRNEAESKRKDWEDYKAREIDAQPKAKVPKQTYRDYPAAWNNWSIATPTGDPANRKYPPEIEAILIEHIKNFVGENPSKLWEGWVYDPETYEDFFAKDRHGLYMHVSPVPIFKWCDGEMCVTSVERGSPFLVDRLDSGFAPVLEGTARRLFDRDVWSKPSEGRLGRPRLGRRKGIPHGYEDVELPYKPSDHDEGWLDVPTMKIREYLFMPEPGKSRDDYLLPIDAPVTILPPSEWGAYVWDKYNIPIDQRGKTPRNRNPRRKKRRGKRK
jgi:hypothetical protein